VAGPSRTPAADPVDVGREVSVAAVDGATLLVYSADLT
jgi:membrane protein implicated in regulation of membrane protease activity